jgi:DNA-binding protein H-NS
MDECSLTEMALDELWDLHQSIAVVLAAKLETQKSELEKRLRRLQATAVLEQVVEPSRRPYPAVTPKFRNPDQPGQTWSGRGHQPRWIAQLLRNGKNIEDLQIAETTRSGEQPCLALKMSSTI